MDNKEKIGSPDREMINIHENYEVEHWANKFGITPQRLREAVAKTGTSVESVKAYLNN